MIKIDKALTLESSHGAGATVLDAGGVPIDVVRIEGARVVLGKREKGFTLTRGRHGLLMGLDVDGSHIEGNRSVLNRFIGFSQRGEATKVIGNVAERNGSVGFEGENGDYESNVAVGNSEGFLVILLTGRRTFRGNAALDNNLAGVFLGGDVEHVALAVTDNIATGNGGVGYQLFVQAAEALIERNFAGGNDGIGFGIDVLFVDSRVEVRNNVAGNNRGDGFDLQRGPIAAERNTASANDGQGFRLATLGPHTLRRNAAIGNRLAGIRTQSSAVVIVQNNLFGNNAGPNCGLVNESGAAITATDNFWGSREGPGPDPADQVCDVGPAATTAVPFARSEFNVPTRAGR